MQALINGLLMCFSVASRLQRRNYSLLLTFFLQLSSYTYNLSLSYHCFLISLLLPEVTKVPEAPVIRFQQKRFAEIWVAHLFLHAVFPLLLIIQRLRAAKNKEDILVRNSRCPCPKDSQTKINHLHGLIFESYFIKPVRCRYGEVWPNNFRTVYWSVCWVLRSG